MPVHKTDVVPQGRGQAPKVRRGAADAPEKHRCAVCRQVQSDTTRAIHYRETERYVCQPCLEAAGQIPLMTEDDQ